VPIRSWARLRTPERARDEEERLESTGKAMVAEFVATFALIFIGPEPASRTRPAPWIPPGGPAHGLVLAIMVSITLHTSGAW